MKNESKNDNVSFSIEKIKEIYSTMCNANIEEIKISIGGVNFRVKRFSKKNDVGEMRNFVPQTINIFERQESIKKEETIVVEEIVSPVNGVFYRSPSPGAPPYVNEGDIVSPGTVLCLIEAMKVMNEIKAEKKCKIIKILCENGSSVSIGTKLFLVEPI
jgi:acetyl-CoA carboxylase biotin carboxyl carrier protein